MAKGKSRSKKGLSIVVGLGVALLSAAAGVTYGFQDCVARPEKYDWAYIGGTGYAPEFVAAAKMGSIGLVIGAIVGVLIAVAISSRGKKSASLQESSPMAAVEMVDAEPAETAADTASD